MHVSGMAEADQGLFDVVGHGHVNSAGKIAPSKSEATVEFTIPGSGDDVNFTEGMNQVLCMLAAFILHTKIVDNKGEEDGGVRCMKRLGVLAAGM